MNFIKLNLKELSLKLSPLGASGTLGQAEA